MGSSGGSMDGYSAYGYPPGSNPEFSGPNQRSAQSSAPSPHPGLYLILVLYEILAPPPTPVTDLRKSFSSRPLMTNPLRKFEESAQTFFLLLLLKMRIQCEHFV